MGESPCRDEGRRAVDHSRTADEARSHRGRARPRDGTELRRREVDDERAADIRRSGVRRNDLIAHRGSRCSGGGEVGLDDGEIRHPCERVDVACGVVRQCRIRDSGRRCDRGDVGQVDGRRGDQGARDGESRRGADRQRDGRIDVTAARCKARSRAARRAGPGDSAQRGRQVVDDDGTDDVGGAGVQPPRASR